MLLLVSRLEAVEVGQVAGLGVDSNKVEQVVRGASDVW